MDKVELATYEYTEKISKSLAEITAKAIAFDSLVDNDIATFNRMLKILNVESIQVRTFEPDFYNQWIYPNSRAIRKYWYDSFKEELYVQYTTGPKLYTFFITSDIFKDLLNARSKGTYMNFIKKYYSRPNF